VPSALINIRRWHASLPGLCKAPQLYRYNNVSVAQAELRAPYWVTPHSDRATIPTQKHAHQPSLAGLEILRPLWAYVPVSTVTVTIKDDK
jgi:hypothetical protein